jgi:hypothetical protein
VTVLEADVYLLDLAELPMTWERDAGPLLLALLDGGWRHRGLLAEAPIGLWRLPSAVGESVTSAWPARFHGPLLAARRWQLRVPGGGELASRAYRFPRLGEIDRMEVSLTLTGRAEPRPAT